MRTTHPWTTRLAAGTLMAVLLASAGFAQVRWGGGYRRSRVPPRYRPADHRDNGFAFCRLQYTSVLSEPAGRGWHTDYPNADTNFMIRLSELTSTKVDFGDRGDPNHWVVEITDPELFSCPFVMTSDVGTMGLNEEEVERLRAYFVKGGFLWVDDFWGTPAWNQWLSQIGRVLPQSEYPLIDLPLDHPLFKALYNILEGTANRQHRLLATLRRDHDLGARRRQRRGALPGHHRRARPHHGRHDPQHRHPGRLGA